MKASVLIVSILVVALGFLYFFFVHLPYSNEKHSPHTIIKPKDVSNYFINKDGLYIFTRKWEVENAKGLIFLIHGFGEHCGRSGYVHFANAANLAGFSVYSLDHQGHGLSNGDRGYATHMEDFADDVNQYVSLVISKHPATMPKFLLGHSMGGLVSTLILQSNVHQFSTVALSGSALKVVVKMQILISIASYLSTYLPKLPTDHLDLTYLTRNQTDKQIYIEDPLVYHDGIKARIGNEFIEYSDKLNKNIRDGKLNIKSIFLFHGEKDGLCAKEGSIELYEKLTTKDKKLTIYPEVYHEPWEDDKKDEINKDILDWFTQHL